MNDRLDTKNIYRMEVVSYDEIIIYQCYWFKDTSD